MADRYVTASGRRLGMTAFGDPMASRLVMMFHPMPGASNFDPLPTTTTHWGVHLLAVDRPGYGASDPLPDGTRASFAELTDGIAAYLRRTEQTAQKLTATDFGHVGVIGWGVGGIAAASLAARHPALVDRLVLIDTPADSHPDQLHAPFTLNDLGVADDDPTIDIYPGTDRRLQRMLHDAGCQGDAGIDFDRSALRNPDWKSDLGRIRADTLLIYGEAHADFDVTQWSSRVAGSHVVRVQNAAALSVTAVWERILAHVAPRHGGM